MPNIGDSEYPDIGLHDCLRIAGIIQSDFGGEVRRAGLAHVLDMSPNGGAFGARLGSMRSWGIIQGRSTLQLTADAIAALEPESISDAASVESDAQGKSSADIRAAAMCQLASNVPLFVELQDRLHAGPLERAVLVAATQELTDASVDEIEARIVHLERIFLEARLYLQTDRDGALRRPPRKVEREPAPRKANRKPDAEAPSVSTIDPDLQTTSEESQIKLRFAGVDMVLAETPENIDMLISVLSNRRRKLLSEMEDDPPTQLNPLRVHR